MKTLFSNPLPPLAERLRPRTINEFVGQEHLVGKNSILRKAILSRHIPSIIFWGPPGVGKTTLAQIIANELKAPFHILSAVSSGIKDVQKVIEKAKIEVNPILFIDEIHRFNKSQQSALLTAVEKGIITLIGATTENPSFEVISPLLSRCQVYILKDFEKKELQILFDKAKKAEEDRIKKKIIIKETEALFYLSGGDARKLYNIFELVVNYYNEKTDEIVFTNDIVELVVQQNIAKYDKAGEQHYDIISAFIKSIRGSDPNAAVYWLARMLKAGEDIKFIARRMLILASEDIGNANLTALVIATSCFNAVDVIGMPEARIILSQTAIYLATSPKSNSAYTAINRAEEIVEKTGSISVPLHIRNAPTGLMKELGYGKNYLYAHNFVGNFVEQEYLPETISGTTIYEPADNPKEKEIRTRLKNWWGKKYNY